MTYRRWGMTHAQLLNALQNRSSHSLGASNILIHREWRDGAWRMLVYSFGQLVGAVIHGHDRGVIALFRPEAEYSYKVRRHHKSFLHQVRTAIEGMLRDHYHDDYIHIGEATASTPDHNPWEWINWSYTFAYESAEIVYDRMQGMAGTPQEETAESKRIRKLQQTFPRWAHDVVLQIDPTTAEEIEDIAFALGCQFQLGADRLSQRARAMEIAVVPTE